MTIEYLVTHSGGFHADELLSSVVLTRLFPDAKIIRTRDEQWITPGEGKIIYDVGRDYDASKLIFDHHQRPTPLREDENPYSSFGLVWAHFGRDYLADFGIPEQQIDDVWGSFDTGFVLPIDQMDNGAMNPSVAGPLVALTLPVLLESLKPEFDNDEENADDEAFGRALTIARAFVEASISRKAAKRRAETVVMDAIAAAGDSAILELPRGMPFRSAIDKAEADHLLFVVNPRGTDWAIGGIRISGDSFEQRADLPASWAGLTDADLEQASGVKGAKFCHNGLFIAVADSREAAMAMAEIAVKEANQRN